MVYVHPPARLAPVRVGLCTPCHDAQHERRPPPSQRRVHARRADCVVVSVEYRMFPEVAANETCKSACDVFAVLRYCASHAAELGIDASRLAIGGDSAGGNLAAACALLARDAAIPLAFQLLVYPVVATGKGPLISASVMRNADAPVINLKSICELSLLANKGALLSADMSDFEQHGISPLCATKGLAGSATAIILSAYYDPLFDQAEEYARALRTAGVDVYYKCYYLMHGFWGGVTSDEGETSLRETATLMRELFTSRDAKDALRDTQDALCDSTARPRASRSKAKSP
jgi:acetyl esterase